MLQQEKPNHFETIVKLVIVIAISILVFVSPFFLYFNYGGLGIIMYLVLVIMLSPSIAFTYKKFIFFKKNELSNAFLSKKTHLVSITVFNVLMFFTIGFNTLIVPYFLMLLYAITYIPVYFYSKKKASYLVTFVSTLVISLLLLLNYYVVSNPKEETYRFVLDRSSSTIFLENNQYDEYDGMRIFWTEEKVLTSGRITYVIYDGILGFRVVKDYRL